MKIDDTVRRVTAVSPKRRPNLACWGLLALVSSVGSSLGLSACQGKPGAGAESQDATPRFVGKTLDGEYLSLEDFRGQVVLVNVWATWCKPCRDELPELGRLSVRHRDAGLRVLGVSVDATRDENTVRAMTKDLGLSYPIVLDPGSHSVGAFRVHGYPTSVLLGRDGRVRWRRTGLIVRDDPELNTQLTAALAEPPPTAPNGAAPPASP